MVTYVSAHSTLTQLCFSFSGGDFYQSYFFFLYLETI